MYDALLPYLKAGMAEQQKKPALNDPVFDSEVWRPQGLRLERERFSRGAQGLLCIFVLKKGLKLTDVAVQEAMIPDALAIFEKATAQK